MAQPSDFSLRDALEVFNECIKNGSEINDLCDKCTHATIKSHPIFKKLVDKIRDDTKSIEQLKSKIDELRVSVEGNNYQKWKKDVGNVIETFESASHETLANVSKALAATGAKKIRKKFEENEKILSDSDLTKITDETVRKFTQVLLERNQKIVECLKYAHSLLPKYFAAGMRKKRRKLFIIGDDLNKSMSQREKSFVHLGEVTIKNQSASNLALSKSQLMDFKLNLNGYLIDDSEKTEVMLELIEPGPGANFMEFSQSSGSLDTSKLSATIEINGEVDENVEIVEINVSPDKSLKGAEALAVIENNQTGSVSHVPIKIVPASPEKPVHGKILEIQSASPVKDVKFRDASGPPPYFATPSRKDRNVRREIKSQYYTPVRSRRDRIKNINLLDKLNASLLDRPVGHDPSTVINQIIQDTADKVVNAIMGEQPENLQDISELDFANISSGYSPNISGIGRMDASLNLGDVSEIEYANLSNYDELDTSTRLHNITPGSNLADVSEINYASFSSPQRPQLTRQNATLQSPQLNLQDVSEIEFADVSQAEESIRILEDAIESIRQGTPTRGTPVRGTPGRGATVRLNRTQPAEGILIDIGTPSPPRPPQARTVVFNDGNLMQFEESPRAIPQSPNRRNGKLQELMTELNEVVNENPTARLRRREKVHDRSLPYYGQVKSSNKALNRSLPSRMPVSSKRIEFPRPVQAVPSRIPEDAPTPVTSVVIHRSREALSPLRPNETIRINEALDQISNPFGNVLQLPTPATSQSYREDQNQSIYETRNASLPLHLTPMKEPLAPMERSLMTEYQTLQRNVSMFEEALQDISQPSLASMSVDDSENLEDVSLPFSESFNEAANDYSMRAPPELPVQATNDFLAKFDEGMNLNDVSFELMNDEI